MKEKLVWINSNSNQQHARGRSEMYTKFEFENMNGREGLGDLGIDGR
jgi:hypothetical protein